MKENGKDFLIIVTLRFTGWINTDIHTSLLPSSWSFPFSCYAILLYAMCLDRERVTLAAEMLYVYLIIQYTLNGAVSGVKCVTTSSVSLIIYNVDKLISLLSRSQKVSI